MGTSDVTTTTNPVSRVLGRLSVRGKLVASYGILSVLVITVVGVGAGVASSARSSATTSKADIAATRALKDLQVDAVSVAVAANSVPFDYVSHADPTGDLQSLHQYVAAFQDQSKVVSGLKLDAVEAKYLATAQAAFATYDSLTNQAAANYKIGTPKALTAAGNEVAALAFSSITTPINSLVARYADQVNARTASAVSAANQDETLVIVLGGFFILLALVSAASITRSITRPIGELTRALAAVTEGDLAARASVSTSDELGMLARHLNEAIVAQESGDAALTAAGRADAAAAADYEAAADVLVGLDAAATVEDACRNFVDRLVGNFRLAGACLYEADPDTGRLVYRYEAGKVAAKLHRESAENAGRLGQAVQSRKVTFVGDLSSPGDDPRSKAVASAGVAAVAWLPVFVEGSLRAVVEAFFNEPFGDRRERALSSLPAGFAGQINRIDTQARERQAQAELRSKVDQILQSVDLAARGDLTVEVPVAGSDAVGQLGERLSGFIADLRQKMALIGENSVGLAGAADELSTSASDLSVGCEQASAQATVVSEGSESVSDSIRTVATAATELTASIQEIAQNAAEAARVATMAANVAQSTNATIGQLGDSSAEIGNVIKVITTIAQQTNLLALNATIEAARAGESGRGFAVVANEVKDLAMETAGATEDIAAKIEAIQNDTAGAVAAIGSIGEIIDRINELQTTIAAAVEEQTATTNAIAGSVSMASAGASDITANIGSVAQVSSAGAIGAADTKRAAAGVAQLASQLQALVGAFRY